MENDECFVKDIYAASFLFACGKRLLRLHREKNFYWFVFENKEECDRLLDDYWRGEGMVRARAYSDACRTLKDRVFSQR